MITLRFQVGGLLDYDVAADTGTEFLLPSPAPQPNDDGVIEFVVNNIGILNLMGSSGPLRLRNTFLAAAWMGVSADNSQLWIVQPNSDDVPLAPVPIATLAAESTLGASQVDLVMPVANVLRDGKIGMAAFSDPGRTIPAPGPHTVYLSFIDPARVNKMFIESRQESVF